MFGLGMSEIIFLGVLALIVIGPKELPQLARTLGRFINELKRSTNVLGDELKQQARVDFDLNSRPRAKHAHQEAKPLPTEEGEPQQLDLTTQENSANSEINEKLKT